MSTLRPPITADGGNIQTNGLGLGITTTALIEHNAERGYTEHHVSRLMREYYGISDLVFLEPLAGEQTGHVDMFAVFASNDTVIVGRYDPRDDPVNAAILDRNAERLSRLHTRYGPLRVVRIPMPPRSEKVWRTYTNVLFANGTLLVPRYADLDPNGHAIATAVFRRVLPGWSIRSIDCEPLITWGGAIHCVTMNLCRVQGNDVPPTGMFDEPDSRHDGYQQPAVRGDRRYENRRRRPLRARPQRSRPLDVITEPGEDFAPERRDSPSRFAVDGGRAADEPEWYPHGRTRGENRAPATIAPQVSPQIESDDSLWKSPWVSEADNAPEQTAEVARDAAPDDFRLRSVRTSSHDGRRAMFVDDGGRNRRVYEAFQP